MALTYTPMTELEAVNVMLESIGEQPVNSIDPQDITQEASLAQTILHGISRDVQALGWYFNEGYEVTLSPDGNQNILIPTDALKIVVVGETDAIGIRGDRLYNRTENTDVFTESVDAYVVYFLAFTDLPQSARAYVTIRAARVFQQRVLGAENLDKFNQEDERRAWVLLQQDEVDNQGFNFANLNLRRYRNQ